MAIVIDQKSGQLVMSLLPNPWLQIRPSLWQQEDVDPKISFVKSMISIWFLNQFLKLFMWKMRSLEIVNLEDPSTILENS